MRVGILALQGGFADHQSILTQLDVDYCLIRQALDLTSITHLIIPGGESSTMLNLLDKHRLWKPLKEFCDHHPVFGTCAGAILMAKKVTPQQNSLNLINCQIRRNAYGRQNESFLGDVNLTLDGQVKQAKLLFIRAPQFSDLSPDVNILGTHNQAPVLLQQGSHLAASFHPELCRYNLIHRYFLNMD